MSPSVVRRSALCAAFALATALALPATSVPVAACPAPPTLSQRIDYADAIVVGKVTSIEERVVESEDPEQSYTVYSGSVRVETVLKGRLDAAQPMRVDSIGYGSREEVEGLKSSTLLLFTSYDDEEKCYEMDGVEDVTDFEAMEAYVARVREMLDILAIPGYAEQRPLRVEWAIRCVEAAATREGGIEELSRASWDVDDDGEERGLALDGSQRERLVDVLLGIADFSDWGAFQLADLLAEERDPRVLSHLSSLLAGTADRPGPEAEQLMDLVARHLDWKTGSWLAGRYDEDASLRTRRESVARYLDLMARLEELPEAAEPDGGDFAEAEREAVERYEAAQEEAVAEHEAYASGEEPEVFEVIEEPGEDL